VKQQRREDGAIALVLYPMSSASQARVGKGGVGVLSVYGNKVGQARIDRTVPFLFSADDLMDIGKDTGSPVTENYGTPQGRFTGSIAWVRIDIGKDVFRDAAGMDVALAGRS
jgi:arylsulfatase